MRVVQVYKDYEPPVFGGIEHTLRLLSEGLAARGGMEVTVLCSSESPTTTEERLGGVRVVRAATFGRVARAPVSPTLARWIRKLKPDVLHLHHPNPTGELACLLARPRCPVVLTYYCDIVRQRRLLALYRHPLRWLLRRVDSILVPTPSTLEENPFLRPHRSKCEVVPLGIRPDDLAETPRTRELAARLAQDHPGFRVLFVGRMRPYKGLPVLIEAMDRIPATLVLVGRGEMEEEVKQIVRERGMEKRVVFAGDVPAVDLPGYYQAADLFVLPSLNRSEAFGIAMVEAMHFGLPVISTRLGTGTSHVNRNGLTGLEVPPGDPTALADAIRWMEDHPENARRMGLAGKDHARGFTEEAMVDRIASLYGELVQSARASKDVDHRPRDAGKPGSAVA
jgi:glycosyltransferase involved in cell wall biosynthesis